MPHLPSLKVVSTPHKGNFLLHEGREPHKTQLHFTLHLLIRLGSASNAQTQGCKTHWFYNTSPGSKYPERLHRKRTGCKLVTAHQVLLQPPVISNVRILSCLYGDNLSLERHLFWHKKGANSQLQLSNTFNQEENTLHQVRLSCVFDAGRGLGGQYFQRIEVFFFSFLQE